MKRFFYLVALVVFALILVACGSDEADFPEEGGDTVVVETEYDDHGWKGKLAVTFDGNLISEAEYDEFDRQGNSKADDEDYASRMVPVSGISPAEAFDELEASLVDAQDPEAMDAVTGATQSSDWFIDLAERAVEEHS